jgi:hypothetical protein
MPIVIEPLTEAWSAAVLAFNCRLQAGGCDEFVFPEQPEAARQEWLVLDDGCVRGGYILRAQDFSFGGRIRQVAHYRLPLSEGVIDKAYVGVGALMLRHALAQQPLLFALGMGGMNRPLPRMLQAMGWSLRPVGFYFKVLSPARFLRNIRLLRKTAVRRTIADVAAWSGAGWLGLHAIRLGKGSRGGAGDSPATKEAIRSFGPWADELWDRCHARYAAIGVRSGDILNKLYAGDERFLLWRVVRQGTVIGWAVALDTAMRDDKYFGNLRLGSIVDVLALPEDAPAVMAAAAKELQQRGVDLIVSNQCHKAWADALRQAGFLEGPSNFIFAASKNLAALSSAFDGFHINRGDGDGPIHL